MKIFVYPQHKRKQVINPYTNNMENALGGQFEVVHLEYRWHLPQPLRLLLGSTKSDVYVLNWLDSVAEGEGNVFLRGMMALLALRIIVLRKAIIVWLFHNIHPHRGETKWSQRIKRILFKKSSIIVSHSKEATEYAKRYAKCPVFFKNHPIKQAEFEKWDGEVRECDYYIWGNIFPYKGVVEFINNPLCKASARKVLVVGKCGNPELRKVIETNSNDNVVFENRCADFSEVAAQCKKSKYVLFPYIGDSVSSSGALMDTLLMGGTPVGPNRGAFADLAEQGCCITYNSIDEVFKLPINEGEEMKLREIDVHRFLEANSWASFALWLKEKVSKP